MSPSLGPIEMAISWGFPGFPCIHNPSCTPEATMLTSTDGTAAQRSAPKGGVADAKREPGGPWRPWGIESGKRLKPFWLVVDVYPSETYESVGMMTFPICRKIKNVPNHQPALYNCEHANNWKKGEKNGFAAAREVASKRRHERKCTRHTTGDSIM